jgi:predicted membrane protein
MTSKQKTIMLCFNFVALTAIVWSGWQLHRDIQALLFRSKFFGMSRQVMGRFTFVAEIHGETVTVYNYLFIFALAAIIINIILFFSFGAWNKHNEKIREVPLPETETVTDYKAKKFLITAIILFSVVLAYLIIRLV